MRRQEITQRISFDYGTQPVIDGGEMFSSEEMQIIREQYEERLAQATAASDEFEWAARRALVQVREVIEGHERIASQLVAAEASLLGLLKSKPMPRAITAEAAPVAVRPLPTLPQTGSSLNAVLWQNRSLPKVAVAPTWPPLATRAEPPNLESLADSRLQSLAESRTELKHVPAKNVAADDTPMGLSSTDSQRLRVVPPIGLPTFKRSEDRRATPPPLPKHRS